MIQYTKGSIIDQTYLPKSPLPPPFQRGEFLPFVKGGKEGFRIGGQPYYGLIISLRKVGAARRAARYRATRRVAPTTGFARLACRGELPLAHQGRPAGRPYNRTHRLGDFLRDHQYIGFL